MFWRNVTRYGFEHVSYSVASKVGVLQMAFGCIGLSRGVGRGLHVGAACWSYTKIVLHAALKSQLLLAAGYKLKFLC